MILRAMTQCTPSPAGEETRAGVLACPEMKKKKRPKDNDFAPLPRKALLVEEAEFDKVITKLLRSSSVGIYEIKFSSKHRPKRSGRQP